MIVVDLASVFPICKRFDYLIGGQRKPWIVVLAVVFIDSGLDRPRVVVVVPFGSGHKGNRGQSKKDAQ